MIAIAIIVLAATSLVVLGDRTVAETEFYSRYNTAIFLTKEGMEILSDDTVRGEADPGDGEEYFINYEDKGDGFLWEDENNECEDTNLVIVDDYYSYGDGDETNFSRCAYLEEKDDSIEAEVIVYFEHRGTEYDVTLYRTFYDE